jgi:hypothetical protein
MFFSFCRKPADLVSEVCENMRADELAVAVESTVASELDLLCIIVLPEFNAVSANDAPIRLYVNVIFQPVAALAVESNYLRSFSILFSLRPIFRLAS